MHPVMEADLLLVILNFLGFISIWYHLGAGGEAFLYGKGRVFEF